MSKIIPIKDSTLTNLSLALLDTGCARCVYARRDLSTLMFFLLHGYVTPGLTHTAKTLPELEKFFVEKAHEFQDDMSSFLLIAGGRFLALDTEAEPVEEGLAVLYLFEHRIFYLTMARSPGWDIYNHFRAYLWDPSTQTFEFSTEDWMNIIPIYNRSERC